jgi:c-di-GMP-binding flagellar brake protein YcgR
MERRRYRRFDISIPIKFRIRLPESPEVSWLKSGVLKNISGGGVYFVSNDALPLEPGQIRDLTITPSGESPGFSGAPLINGTTRVVRIDPPRSGDHDIGVALELLSGTIYYIPVN